MVTLNLEKIFGPESIAVIGASNEEGSVGYALMKNLTENGYKKRYTQLTLTKQKFWVLLGL